MKYPEDSIQSQYAASPVIRRLIDAMNRRIDPEADIDLFFNEIFNILTARGRGLDIWGRILVVDRLLQVEVGDPFGFAGSGQPFNQTSFYYPGVTNNYALTDEPFRELLLFKALANISASDAATINMLLGRLLGGKAAYVIEAGPMAIRYIFEFSLQPWQRSIFQTMGVLTRGAGVGYEWLEIDPPDTFGFADSDLQPFGQGAFFLGGPVKPISQIL